MFEKKYVVPEGMLKAACNAYSEEPELRSGTDIRSVLEAALYWLAENPIVPTHEQAGQIMSSADPMVYGTESAIRIAVEWQRRMFLAPKIGRFAEATAMSLRGVMLTKEEADFLHDQINIATRP